MGCRLCRKIALDEITVVADQLVSFIRLCDHGSAVDLHIVTEDKRNLHSEHMQQSVWAARRSPTALCLHRVCQGVCNDTFEFQRGMIAVLFAGKSRQIHPGFLGPETGTAENDSSVQIPASLQRITAVHLGFYCGIKSYMIVLQLLLSYKVMETPAPIGNAQEIEHILTNLHDKESYEQIEKKNR